MGTTGYPGSGSGAGSGIGPGTGAGIGAGAGTQPRDRIGRFGTKPHGAPGLEVRLDEQIPAHLDGSFRFPPRLRTAAEVVEFWSSVEVPDEALEQAQRVYVATFDQVTTSFPEHRWSTFAEDRWVDQHPRGAAPAPPGESEADYAQRKAAAKAAFVAEMTEQLADRPPELRRTDVRPIVRALGMMDAADDLPDPAERDAVAGHVVEVAAVESTVEQLAERTGLVDLRRYILDPGEWHPAAGPATAAGSEAVAVEEIQRLQEQIERLQRVVSGLEDGIYDRVNARVTQLSEHQVQWHKHVMGELNERLAYYTAQNNGDLKARGFNKGGTRR